MGWWANRKIRKLQKSNEKKIDAKKKEIDLKIELIQKKYELANAKTKARINKLNKEKKEVSKLNEKAKKEALEKLYTKEIKIY